MDRFEKDIRKLSLPIFLPDGEERLHCITRVQDALIHLHGVQDASINNAHNTLRLAYNPHLVTFSRLAGEVRRAGADIAARMEQAAFALDGLELPEDAVRVERMLYTAPGVVWAGVNYTTGLAHIEFLVGQINIPDLQQRLARQGARPRLLEVPPPVPAASSVSAEPPTNLTGIPGGGWQSWLAFALGTLFGLVSLGAMPVAPNLALGLQIASILSSSWPLLRSIWFGLSERRITGHLLLLIAFAGTLALGHGTEAVLAAWLYALGWRCVALALTGGRQEFRAMRQLVPGAGRVLREGTSLLLPVQKISVGETVLVLPGELVPLDGEVTSGSGTLTERSLFGEAKRREVCVGSSVFAGAENGSEPLEIQVTRFWQDTQLWRTLLNLEEAITQRPAFAHRAERLAQNWMRLLLPYAVGMTLLPPLFSGGRYFDNLPFWAERGLGLLFLTNPTLLWLSPVLLTTTVLREAVRRGMLVRSGWVIEQMCLLRAILYDKTGTLTKGCPVVVDTVPLGPMNCVEILYVAAALEQNDPHPIARAVCAEAHRHAAPGVYEVSERHSLPGQGIFGVVNGVDALLGSPSLFREQRIPLTKAAEEALADAERQGYTSVLLGSGSGLLGALILSDTPRTESAEVVNALRALGVTYQGLLSGDTPTLVMQMGKTIGLDEAEGGLTPEQKRERLREIRQQFRCVGMFGEDTGDARAQAIADLRFTLNASESQTSLEAADVAMLNNRLAGLPELMRQSRQLHRSLTLRRWIALTSMIGLSVGTILWAVPLWLLALLQAIGALILTRTALPRYAVAPAQEEAAQPMQEAHPALPASAQPAPEKKYVPLLELVFVHDPSVDEEPKPGYIYPEWQRFVVPFEGDALRFGRRAASSTLPLQVDDEGMSRLHGEFRMEGGKPVVIDLNSTNGIRRNGPHVANLIPPQRPTPLRFGDTLYIGRNTRIEIRPPGWAAQHPPPPLTPRSPSSEEQTASSQPHGAKI